MRPKRARCTPRCCTSARMGPMADPAANRRTARPSASSTGKPFPKGRVISSARPGAAAAMAASATFPPRFRRSSATAPGSGALARAKNPSPPPARSFTTCPGRTWALAKGGGSARRIPRYAAVSSQASRTGADAKSLGPSIARKLSPKARAGRRDLRRLRAGRLARGGPPRGSRARKVLGAEAPRPQGVERVARPPPDHGAPPPREERAREHDRPEERRADGHEDALERAAAAAPRPERVVRQRDEERGGGEGARGGRGRGDGEGEGEEAAGEP